MKIVKINADKWQLSKIIKKLRSVGISEEQIREAGVRTSNFWTKERCVKEARKYKTQKEWRQKHYASVVAAQRYGWLKECTAHMIKNKYPKGFWTKERCVADAKKYKTIGKWYRKSMSAYAIATRKGWSQECTAHMGVKHNRRNFWNNKKRCVKEARKYKNKTTWQQKSSPSYYSARRNGWMEECASHMENKKNPKGFWTIEKLTKEASKYSIKAQWKKNSYPSYAYAYKHGLANKLTKHMTSDSKLKKVKSVENGKIFISITKAAVSIGVSRNTLVNYINNGRKLGGHKWEYV